MVLNKTSFGSGCRNLRSRARKHKIRAERLKVHFVLGAMEYKGIEYSVVQTACPTGWKWVAQLSAMKTSTGKASSRPEAIRLAHSAIEKVFAAQSTAKTLETFNNSIDVIELRRRYAELQRLREQVRELETVVG